MAVVEIKCPYKYWDLHPTDKTCLTVPGILSQQGPQTKDYPQILHTGSNPHALHGCPFMWLYCVEYCWHSYCQYKKNNNTRLSRRTCWKNAQSLLSHIWFQNCSIKNCVLLMRLYLMMKLTHGTVFVEDLLLGRWSSVIMKNAQVNGFITDVLV